VLTWIVKIKIVSQAINIMLEQKKELSMQEMQQKAKDLAKLFDGLSRCEALFIISQIPQEIDLNSKVLFSPTC
jgi:hypothetical protein